MHQHQTQETLSESSKSRTTCTTDTTIISCDNGRSSGNKCKSRTSDNEKSSSSSLTTSPTSTLSSSTAKSSDTKDRTKAPKKSQKQQEMETEESPGNYRVDSPQSSVSKEEKRSSIAKSRSLDSDETLKIVELKGDNENLESNCTELVNNAIITEIESDWELTNDLTLKSINHAVVNEVVNGVEKCQDFDRLSQTVRNGTIVTELTNEETLPDEFSANIEDLRKERLSKLVEYFGPVYPRCLDVISEEGSDLSDSSVAVTQTKVECCLPEFVHLSDTSESDTEICDDLLDDALENSLQNQFFELNFKEEIDTDKGELVNFDIKKFCEELIDEILDNAESFLEKQFCDLNIKKNISSFKISKDSEEIEKDADNLHKTEETVEKDNENSKIFIDNYLNEILEEVFTEKEPVETAIKENSSLEQKTTNLQENKNLESTELITEKEKMKSSLGINKKTIFLTEEPKNKDSDASDEEIISYFQRKETKSEESKSSDSDASTVKHFSPQNPQIKLLKTNPLTLKDLCFSTLNDLNLNSIPELLQKIFNDSSSAEEVEEVIVNTENTENYSKEVTETFKEEHCVLEEIDENASRRLLDIIKKEKNPLLENAVPFFEDSEYLHEARSRARDLDEWLQLTTFGRNRNTPRSRSLPAEVHVRQMQLLIAQEKHLQEDLERLEAQKRVLLSAMTLDAKRSEVSAVKEDPQVPNSIEKKRLQMYQEYLDEWHSRQQRRHDKLIRISLNENQDFSSSSGAQRGAQNEIEREFMEKLRQKQRKVEKADSEEEEETNRVQVIDEGEIYHRKLPKHLQEFVEITTREQNVDGDGGVWSPGQKSNFDPEDLKRELSIETNPADFADESIAPVWSPRSAASSPTAERKEFRPVPFESPVLARKSKLKTQEIQKADPPWKTHPLESSRLPSSFSSPGFNNSPEFATRLPKAQNPTITLLQKAREGQIPKSATYIEQERIRRKHESPYNSNSDLVYELRTESISDSDSERPKKGPRKVDSNTIHHMPFGLRSEAKNDQMSQWYKKMYHTMNKQHPNKYEDDEYVLIRYKQRNRAGRYPFATGYLSEPEAGAYDSDADYNKYATLDRRRTPFANVPSVSTLKSSISKEKSPDKSFTYKDTTTISYKPETQKVSSPPYKPKPIEYYRPGESSIAETEAKRWWDEVMDIFDGMEKQQNQQRAKVMHQLPTYQTKGYLSQALKESGYESDSTLVFRRREDGLNQQLASPSEQKEQYKSVQKGGDVPLYGLRKPAPEKPREPEGPPPPPPSNGTDEKINAENVSETESPRKYVENEVTIHYRTPVRQEIKEMISEDELRRRQADAMRKIYEEERQRKYLQVSHSSHSDNEIQDMKSRRHTDNFTPSQKSPISLNRYDDFVDDLSPRATRAKSPEPRLIAKALYNFLGQSAKELTFKKGDIIFIRRQVDKNWYEGEINAMIGLFPANYVEIVPYDGFKTTSRKPHEGQARAKYNFIAQTHLELSLAKGELVVITRRVDDNWFEGRVGGRKGIFPVSYVEVLVDPGVAVTTPSKPVASPAAHSLVVNGRESLGAHNYVPSFPPVQGTQANKKAKTGVQVNGTYGTLNQKNLDQALHIDIQNEPIPYRAMYKYKPQNEDELELLEGDKVLVLEKCDDGWYVGTSERTGAFGTFPGNYVERI